MDIKASVEQVFKKVTDDKGFAAKFQKEPVKALEEVLGVDLPDESIQKIVDAVKVKMTADTAGDLLGKVGNLMSGK